MENLKRYDCDFDQCGIMDNGMIPNPKGAYVKFSDVEVALRSASDNTSSAPCPWWGKGEGCPFSIKWCPEDYVCQLTRSQRTC